MYLSGGAEQWSTRKTVDNTCLYLWSKVERNAAVKGCLCAGVLCAGVCRVLCDGVKMVLCGEGGSTRSPPLRQQLPHEGLQVVELGL